MIRELINMAPRPVVGAAHTLEIAGRMGRYVVGALKNSRKISDLQTRRKFLSEKVHRDCAAAVRAMGFEIDVVGFDAKMMAEHNFLIVSNHMSYLDVLILASVQPSVFVTSVDMGQVPVLGQLANLGGSIFVERRHRGQIERDIQTMTDALKAGITVGIYPEGTSTNGLQILPFKKSLLMSAVEAGRDILPVVLNYMEIDGEPFGTDNLDKVCWYGDRSFASHFLELMQVRHAKVRLEFLAPIRVTKDSTRAELTEKAHTAIRDTYMRNLPPGARAAAEALSTMGPPQANRQV